MFVEVEGRAAVLKLYVATGVLPVGPHRTFIFFVVGPLSKLPPR
jgi:hypothetical protein